MAEHNHDHRCQCEHKDVAFCKHCHTVYCKGCNQEWTAKTSWYYPYLQTTYGGALPAYKGFGPDTSLTGGAAEKAYPNSMTQTTRSIICNHLSGV